MPRGPAFIAARIKATRNVARDPRIADEVIRWVQRSESTRGVPLAGLAVKVTNSFFLIGLSSVDADRARNIQLLKEQAWFDIPVVYNDGRRTIIAIEKVASGDRAFARAFEAWGQ